jgi:hypothetical protein
MSSSTHKFLLLDLMFITQVLSQSFDGSSDID